MSVLRIIVTLFLLFVSNFSLKSQEEITFDRPGITDLYNITTKNKFQFEVGYDYLNFIKKQESFPSITIRYGINKKTELRYIFDYSFYNDNMIKNCDSNKIILQCLGLKKHLFKFNNNINVSLILNAKFPLNLNSNFYGFDAIAVIQKEFKSFDLISNIGTTYENNQFKNQLFLGNCFSLNLGKKSALFIEDYYFWGKEIKHGDIIGYTYSSSQNSQIDFSMGILNYQTKSLFGGVGFSYRL
jgi:hypothetical protein